MKATAVLALPFMVWVWMRHLAGNRLRAFAIASAGSLATLIAVFAVLSALAGVGLGWLTALAGSVKIINWLTVPTAVANLQRRGRPVHAGELLCHSRGDPPGGHHHHPGFTSVVVAIPPRRPGGPTGHRVGDAGGGAFVPAALPWYPLHLAVGRGVGAGPSRSGRSPLIAGFSTWIMVIFKPDGSHGMYSWVHVLLATACGLAAWYSLQRADSWRNPTAGPR